MDPKECVFRNFRAFGARDADGVINTYTPDCELVDVTQPQGQAAGGHQALRDYLKQFYQCFPDIRVTNERVISEGHTVAAQFELHGTHKGEFMGFPATGKTIRWITCSFFDLTDDNARIKKETYYYDMASLVAQLRGRPDDSQRNERVARECIEAVIRGDWDGVRRAYAEDGILVDPLLPDPVRGKEAIVELYRSCREQEPDMQGKITTVVAQGDGAVVEWRSWGTVAKPFPGMPASTVGKRVEIPEVNIFKLRDGLIVSNTVYADTGAIARQLGVAD